MESEKVEMWAILDLLGHVRLAGKVSEFLFCGTPMVRVDIPATKLIGAFHKLYGIGSVYSITPVDEQIARSAAEQLAAVPIDAYTAGQLGNDLMKEAHQRYGRPQLPVIPEDEEWG